MEGKCQSNDAHSGSGFQKLPPEIILAIADKIRRQKDLNALVQSTRKLYELANAILYCRDATYKDQWALPWACWRGNHGTLSKALEAGSIVGMEGDCIAIEPKTKSTVWRHLRILPLEMALNYGHTEIAKTLLAHGAKVYDDLHLTVCIRTGNDDTILSLARYLPGAFGKSPQDMSGPGTHITKLAIYTALRNNQPRAVEAFAALWPNGIETFPDLDDAHGLICAAQGGSIQLVKKWFEWRGPNRLPYPEVTWSRIRKAATISASSEGIELIEFLREQSYCFTDSIQDYITSRCSQGNAVLLKWLLKLPEVDPQLRDKWLSAPSTLRHAINSKSLETVEIVLRPESARNPAVFTEACLSGTVEIVQALVRAGMDPCLAPDSGSSYIAAAIEFRNDPVINFLLDQGVKVPTDALWHLILPRRFVRERLPKAATIRRLISVTGGADQRHDLGLLLHRACEQHDMQSTHFEESLDIVKTLVQHGANVNVTATSHRYKANQDTPLAAACHGNNIKLIHFLIDNGAKVNSADDTGTSPLHHACSQHNPVVVELMLNSGAEADTLTTQSQMTPLLSACAQDWKGEYENYKPGDLCKVLVLLLNSGANPNAETRGATAIHLICCGWFFDMNPLYLLIEHGATFDSTDNMGETPLHKACSYRNVTAVRVLLEHGARVHHKNTRGETPISKLFDETFRPVYGDHAANVAELMFSYGAHISHEDAVLVPARQTRVEQVLRRYNAPYEVRG